MKLGSVEVKWRGKRAPDAIKMAFRDAVEDCALLLVKETRKALSKSGPNKDLQKEFGIDKESGPHDFRKGREALWTGVFTDSKGKEHAGMYFYGEPLKKWVQASPVGEPPHQQTGSLLRSIEHEMMPNGITARVGPLDELEYARRHEIGGPDSYPDRPFLKPTLERLQGKIRETLTKAAKRAVK